MKKMKSLDFTRLFRLKKSFSTWFRKIMAVPLLPHFNTGDYGVGKTNLQIEANKIDGQAKILQYNFFTLLFFPRNTYKSSFLNI